MSVVLVPWSPEWAERFAEARTELLPLFEGVECRIEHVGGRSAYQDGKGPFVERVLAETPVRP